LLEITLIAASGGERVYLDTSREGWFQPPVGENVILDDRLSPGVGPYCQAMRVDDFIAVSGMVATGQPGELIGPYDVTAQTNAILDAINISLERLGSHRDDVVKTLVTITDWRRMGDYNATYAEFFQKPYPARATIGGGLAQYGLLIEIEAFAIRGSRETASVVVAGPAS
jgi:2-iminobutanoate/2-iminopropanoate deaminase